MRSYDHAAGFDIEPEPEPPRQQSHVDEDPQTEESIMAGEAAIAAAIQARAQEGRIESHGRALARSSSTPVTVTPSGPAGLPSSCSDGSGFICPPVEVLNSLGDFDLKVLIRRQNLGILKMLIGWQEVF